MKNNSRTIGLIAKNNEVSCILSERQSMFIRAVKPQPPEEWLPQVGLYHPTKIDRKGEEYPGPEIFGASDERFGLEAPYQPGDIIYLREAFLSGYKMDDGTFNHDEHGELIPMTWFRATDDVDWYDGTSDWPSENPPWKSAAQMPQSEARIWLKAEDVKILRLQDIREEQAMKICVPERYLPASGSTSDGSRYTYALECFYKETHDIEAWNRNEWQWLVSFSILSTTGKPSLL